MITFEKVSKEFTPGKPVVSDFNLEIKDGEFFVLIGPSGSGKTTVLKMINRLISLTEGYIRIDNQPISEFHLQELRWNIGYVLQQIALFPHMTVEENITVVPEMKQWPKKEMYERVTELLNSVGLEAEEYRDRKVSSLSGGQQQRIGVVRALAADPDIILMDEPFSALDPISRSQLQKDVIELQKELKKTIVFVTHDMQEALLLGDRICLMNQGKIEQVGTPEDILENPRNEFVKDFLQTGLPGYRQKERIEALVHKGFVERNPVEKEASIPVLSSTESIDALVTALSSSPSVYVANEEGTFQGQITQSLLLSYLSEKSKTKSAVMSQ